MAPVCICSYERGRVLWRLSSGPFITQEIADIVIHNPHVIGVDDCLFGAAVTPNLEVTAIED